MRQVKNKKIGFTLAEVLFAITVIGICVMLTIPALITTMQTVQLKVLWKDTYSRVDQSTRLIMLESGGTMTGVNIWDYPDLYGKYLKYIKKCTGAEVWSMTSDQDCWHVGNDPNIKDINGSGPPFYFYPFSGYGAFVLSNGSMIYIVDGNSECTSNNNYPAGYCTFMYVDVNGLKPPNTWGKDMFGIWITKNGAKPWGVQNDEWESGHCCIEDQTSCDSGGSFAGFACGALYLRQ